MESNSKISKITVPLIKKDTTTVLSQWIWQFFRIAIPKNTYKQLILLIHIECFKYFTFSRRTLRPESTLTAWLANNGFLVSKQFPADLVTFTKYWRNPKWTTSFFVRFKIKCYRIVLNKKIVVNFLSTILTQMILNRLMSVSINEARFCCLFSNKMVELELSFYSQQHK